MTSVFAPLVVVAAAAAGVAVADTPAKVELRVVIAASDRTHRAAQFPLRLDTGAATHVWVWSDDLPPRRFPADAVPRDAQQIVGELRRPPATQLDVRVRGWSRPEELASLRVIAAPLEMWDSVPEPLLPAYPVTKEGRVRIAVRQPVRIRVVGGAHGSLWEDVSRSAKTVDLTLRRPAADAVLQLRSADGKPVRRAFAAAMQTRRGDATASFRAQFATDDRGAIRIGALPESEVITILLTAEDAAPQMISGTAAELTREFRLQSGSRVRGTFVDEAGQPLPRVTVEAETWISPEAPVATRRKTASSEQGQWVLTNLAGREVALRASADGRTTYRKSITLEGEEIDIGTIALRRASAIKLTVSDTEHRPLSGVTVTTDGGVEAKTDAAGSVVVTTLAPDETTTVTLTASGFAKRTVQLVPPLAAAEQIVLERAFSVAGTVVDEHGAPVSEALAIVTTGPSDRRTKIGTDGTFSLEIEPGKEFELAFESPSSAPLSRKETAGRAGEVRNLGTVRLSSGLAVRGRIVDSAGAPIPAARIWTVRPHVGGAVAAWVAERVARATSDADGRFALHGLTPGRADLRIDATDYARAYATVDVRELPGEALSVTLVRGHTITVRSRAETAVLARLDLRGHASEADMITAPFTTGEARLRDVPPGRYTVAVTNGHTVICERTVDVPSPGADAALECAPPGRLRGRVLIGRTPAFGGVLRWSRPSRGDALIDSRRSALGATQQRVYGGGGGNVVVPVRSDGTFETADLLAGEWQVAWSSPDGIGTPDRTITVPDAAEAQIVVEFSGGVIRGRVVDERNEPVPSARIREIQGPLSAVAGADGSFTIAAVSPGSHRLQAMFGAKASAVVDVSVDPDRDLPVVVLQVDEAERDVLTVRVLGRNGEPKPNAFLFVESSAGLIRTLTADVAGNARASFPEGLRDGARLVAYADNALAFADFRRGSADAPQTAVVRFGDTGSLRIRSSSRSGSPSLFTAGAPGDLSWALGRLGMFLTVSPESELTIDGLPPGLYQVRLGDASAVATVIARRTATAALP